MKAKTLSLFFLAVVSNKLSAMTAADVSTWAKGEARELMPFYKALHQAPELSFEEDKTSATVADQLTAAGYAVTSHVGGFGVVGVLKNGAGKTLMIRTDLDALPVVELTKLAFASQVRTKDKQGLDVGVMHACGHDIHMSTFVGVARFMAQNKTLWHGTLIMIGQPAEERGAGASAMMHAGLFKKFPTPDFALALHVASDLAVGKISYHAGYAMAGADSVDITMNGRGGHGAMPQMAIDPVYMAAQLVLDLQALVSREQSPVDPAVITVGSIHGGTKHNIIPASVAMQITVRSFRPESRTALLEGIKRKAKAVADGARAPEPGIKIDQDPLPPLFNDPGLVGRVVPALKEVVGESNVLEGPQWMASEDFGRYKEGGFPVFMFWAGSVLPERLESMHRDGGIAPSLHSANYFPDAEPTLKVTLAAMTQSALKLLGE